LNSSGGVASYNIDHYITTPAGFYVGVAFITGLGWGILAYLGL
jgi:hypothetical protein